MGSRPNGIRADELSRLAGPASGPPCSSTKLRTTAPDRQLPAHAHVPDEQRVADYVRINIAIVAQRTDTSSFAARGQSSHARDATRCPSHEAARQELSKRPGRNDGHGAHDDGRDARPPDGRQALIAPERQPLLAERHTAVAAEVVFEVADGGAAATDDGAQRIVMWAFHSAAIIAAV
jgi:hypothetical protein